jgi:Zn finger protein HypA/HybF involved in hydrogenase expression
MLLDVLLIDGTCKTCEDFSRPDADNRECIADDCDLDLDIKLIDGTCKACDAYFHPNELNLECIQCEPTADEIILDDGTC